MREAVAAWRSAAADLLQSAGVVGKAVADVVQAQRVGQMGIDHGNDMACGAERPGLDSVLPGKVFDDSVRYPACNLGENGHCMPCRCHGLSYGCLVAAIKVSMTSIFSTAPSSYGTAVDKISNTVKTIISVFIFYSLRKKLFWIWKIICNRHKILHLSPFIIKTHIIIIRLPSNLI